MLRMGYLIALVVLMVGCANKPRIENSLPAQAQPSSLPNEGQGSVCLALSGGGIRSGSVSLGVLQELQQQGVLGKLSMISSVSGGGYPVYGLLETARLDETADLNGLLANYSDFIRHAEKRASFITPTQAKLDVATAAAILAGYTLLRPLGSADLIEFSGGSLAYSVSIHSTFVSGRPVDFDGSPLANYQVVANRVGFPSFVLLGSAHDGDRPPRSGEKYTVGNLFEFSPDSIGSDKVGYWKSYIKKLNLWNAVVASGAAIDAPTIGEQKALIPDWLKEWGFGLGISIHLADGRKIFISDGGFIENQGIVPLVRRNCRRIIAVDASHDPNLSWEGWTQFAANAKELGWKTTEVVDLQGQPVVKGNPWEMASHIYRVDAFKGDQKSEIFILKLGIGRSGIERYPESVKAFWADDLKKYHAGARCEGESLNLNCTFPQQATVQQSFTRSEFRAYRCLGRFMAREYLSTTSELPSVAMLPMDCIPAELTPR
ncbi:MAG: hypothetical protein V4568_18250 [Pseudomonadota bacterium]